MNKYFIAAIGGAVAGVALTAQFAGPIVAQENTQLQSTYEQLDLFGTIFERIKSDYVETVDDKALIEAAVNGMLTSLDPHSSYLPPTNYKDMQAETKGEFGGLGVEVTQQDGFVKVVSPIDGTPAAEAGLTTGDLITHVDGESVLGLTLNQAVDKLRGPVGAEVVITVFREGVDQPFDVTIVRDIIKVKAVHVRTEGRAVVLRITSFTEQTFNDLKAGILSEVEANGGMDNIDGFVLDLRNNPGGLLNQAIEVSDAFLNEGEIVSTRGRNPGDSEVFNARTGDLTNGKPIVVLINGGSASAAEIVAGALKDQARAIVVGTTSFGKGSVQTIMPLQGAGAIRLTTARYYTPSGRSIQGLGVTPDVLVKQIPPVEKPVDTPASAAQHLRSEADLRGALNNDSLTEEERQQLEQERADQQAMAELRNTDFQLSYALDILRGLNVLIAK